MNEITKNTSLVEISPEIVTKTSRYFGEEQFDLELRLFEGDDPKKIYCAYLRNETYYLISQSTFDRIQLAIENGAKFVKINDDLVNINEIRKFKKE